MHLSISKRFEFSSSHRLAAAGWTDDQNLAFYGREALSPHGHGHNYVAYFSFEGVVDQATGMIINVVIIKDKIKALIDKRYDHKYLNLDTAPFDVVAPTAENLATHLLAEAAPLFEGMTAGPVVCHLSESPSSEATAYADGKVERHIWTDFSAARRTSSPHLTDRENEKIFGRAASASGHGHHYRLRVTLGGKVDPAHGMIFSEAKSSKIVADLHDRFDHRNLSTDIPEFEDMPMTTEMLARYFFDHLGSVLPVSRVKLYENDNFFVEFSEEGPAIMGVLSDFHAAHRLHSTALNDSDNREIFGKCNNPGGHGHLYRVECSVAGAIDEKTGTLCGLQPLNETLKSVLDQWNYKHLNVDTDDFEGKVTTGENIISVLWSKLSLSLGDSLHRLRLWETTNNRFTLRRTVGG
ncbi:MAG: 6-carboxytetrahydropterin synthase [Candidatus Zixiibacteriota bacterium]|nr:MAG: 6-carboxytetrahydropterin synthase [candidate division Zixibacteria bacterium]